MIFTPLFVAFLLLKELSNWPQLELILKRRHSSLKWAQVEVNCSIRLGATVLQSWCYFWEKEEFTPFFVAFSLKNNFRFWPQLRVIFKSRRSTLKWAQVEVNCSICLGATVIKVDTFFSNTRRIYPSPSLIRIQLQTSTLSFNVYRSSMVSKRFTIRILSVCVENERSRVPGL